MKKKKELSSHLERTFRGITPTESLITCYSLELISAEELCKKLSFLTDKDIVGLFFDFRRKYSFRRIMDEEITRLPLSERLENLLKKSNDLSKEEKEALDILQGLKSMGVTGHMAISEIFPKAHYLPDEDEEELDTVLPE